MADRKDWNAAREAFVKLGVRALGLDMTPVAEAIAEARAEGYEKAKTELTSRC